MLVALIASNRAVVIAPIAARHPAQIRLRRSREPAKYVPSKIEIPALVPRATTSKMFKVSYSTLGGSNSRIAIPIPLLARVNRTVKFTFIKTGSQV